MESSYLGAYWRSRCESSLRCGERLARCLAGLGEIDDVLGSWFRRTASKPAAQGPVALGPEALGQLLAQGRNRRDVGASVIEELGFSIGLWNRGKPAVGLSGTVGAHPSTPVVLNSLVLDFPPPGADARRLYEPRVAEAIFDVVIRAWEPDWATWTSHALREAQDAAAREPVVGWMTYLTPPVNEDLQGAASRLLRGGSAITIGSDVASASRAAVLDIRTRLRDIDALHPIP